MSDPRKVVFTIEDTVDDEGNSSVKVQREVSGGEKGQGSMANYVSTAIAYLLDNPYMVESLVDAHIREHEASVEADAEEVKEDES